jgi:hypothetical protein
MVFAEDRTLRCMVEKWFGRNSTEPVQVSRAPRIRPTRNRCVRVTLPGRPQAVTIFFFRHDDGSWSVVPPKRSPQARSGLDKRQP